MTRIVDLKIGILLGVTALVAAMLPGCGSKDDKGCGESCSGGGECRSPYVCLKDGMTGTSYCMPETCGSCGSGLRCYYTSPDKDGECSFDNCR